MRRLASVQVSCELISDVFRLGSRCADPVDGRRLPHDIELVDACVDARLGVAVLTFRSDSFRELLPGEAPPLLSAPMFTVPLSCGRITPLDLSRCGRREEHAR